MLLFVDPAWDHNCCLIKIPVSFSFRQDDLTFDWNVFYPSPGCRIFPCTALRLLNAQINKISAFTEVLKLDQLFKCIFFLSIIQVLKLKWQAKHFQIKIIIHSSVNNNVPLWEKICIPVCYEYILFILKLEYNYMPA